MIIISRPSPTALLVYSFSRDCITACKLTKIYIYFKSENILLYMELPATCFTSITVFNIILSHRQPLYKHCETEGWRHKQLHLH